jgi:aminoglycoside phosphotransferase (APT) family kinase protein
MTIFDLSKKVKQIFPPEKLERLGDILSNSTTLCNWTGSTAVYRVSEDLAIKVTSQNTVLNEYKTLLYLREALPTFPAPEVHGLLCFQGLYCLFMSFISGSNLEQSWSRLDHDQKKAISKQLDQLLTELRSLTIPANRQLGGSYGCYDARRSTRYSSQPIHDIAQFEDFVSTGIRASPIYIDFLSTFQSDNQSNCVFTHGDIRPANIMVATDTDGIWRITCILDWECSGFYPEYWEAVKMTNNFMPGVDWDWYSYLPMSVGPQSYRMSWLLDRVRDPNMENS